MTVAGEHGHIAPIRGNLCIKKVSKTEYVDLRDGEIYKFKIHETKDIQSLMGAKQKCIDIIHANSTPDDVFMSITTQENISEKERDRYFGYMNKFTRTDIFRECFGTNYLYTVEKQKRGALHSHLVCFAPLVDFIPYRRLINVWRGIIGGLGSVNCKRIDKPEHIGTYLAKYILKEFASIEKYKRVYVPSKGLKQPIKSTITEKKLRELLPNLRIKKRVIEGEEMVVGYYW
jgi:hypothetical protein